MSELVGNDKLAESGYGPMTPYGVCLLVRVAACLTLSADVVKITRQFWVPGCVR